MNFIKGICIGIGGIAPGLSGSVMLVIFGLYNKCISIIANIFTEFKKNWKFLITLGLGGVTGIFLFSKLIDYLLINHEMYTRYTFLGLVVGTIPIFLKEVKREKFKKKYFIPMIIAFLIGISLLFLDKSLFAQQDNINIIQSIILGVIVAGSMLVPGLDSAVLLNTFGLYDIFVNSISTFNLQILIPAGVGIVVGGLVISVFINKLIKKFYGYTFSSLFGLFIAIIPSVILYDACKLGFNTNSYISILLAIVGFICSFMFSKLNKN